MNVSEYVIGGLANVGATLFTNPIDVIKTRIQLQGELAARGTYVEPYKGIFHGLVTIARNDGLLGLQKGLVPTMYFQFVVNAFRLGIYSTANNMQWTRDKNGDESFGLGLFWGAGGGAVGAYFSSPFFMIKTQLQARAPKQVAVGYQHEHTGMLSALRHIYRQGGIFGLWRGSAASIVRTSIGSGAQLATFGPAKAWLRDHNVVVQPALNSLCAGFIAGCVSAVAMTPPDVIMTRLYNQGLDANGKGLMYRGWLDCFAKTARAEGLYGLYKGFWGIYLRFVPHSALSLVFFDELLALKNKYNIDF
ncbi:PREDICTED: solute carrier family 25 member 35-like [Rhagoletis zephyria]|uniref:solute carrier family 25 member 35-like n=1 Tax=Rhagoletis zephyria TaxID=28612 RepID=UPI00081167AB|nr:PREDICTED: solute carrier family 25 member 35-like [Rhagoletis zephyria]